MKTGKEMSVEYEIDVPDVGGLDRLLRSRLVRDRYAYQPDLWDDFQVRMEKFKGFGDKTIAIQRKYRGLSCYADLHANYDNHKGKMTLYFSLTSLSEEDDVLLEPAFAELFESVGTPYRVMKGSDYELAEKLLGKYNKALERGWLDRVFGLGMIGRKVIDAKTGTAQANL